MTIALHNLKPFPGSRKKSKRVGRGIGSGKGTYAGRGAKGQKARSGSRRRPGFEGGRTPLWMQLPKKRGAKSLHGKPAVVNIAMLERKFAADEIVSPKALMQQGLVRNTRNGVKILGDGTLTKKLTIRGCFVSAKAKAQILQAGGKVIGIAHQENVSRET